MSTISSRKYLKLWLNYYYFRYELFTLYECSKFSSSGGNRLAANKRYNSVTPCAKKASWSDSVVSQPLFDIALNSFPKALSKFRDQQNFPFIFDRRKLFSLCAFGCICCFFFSVYDSSNLSKEKVLCSVQTCKLFQQKRSVLIFLLET